MAKQTVEIKDMAFCPADVSIDCADCVCWTNCDDVPHSIVCDTTGKNLSGDIAPGTSFDKEFPTAEVFHYHCGSMPKMKGVVTVA